MGEKERLDLRHRRVKEIFQIPDAGEDLIDFFLNEEEQELILRFGNEPFRREELPEDTIAGEYHRGVLSKANQEASLWKVNTFYGFLDVFCVSRKQEYDRLSLAQKRKLDDWYFDAYYDTLDTESGCPTQDRVYPLEEMLQVVESDPRQIYLNYCDCRSLTGECGLPTRTCLTWKDGINTFVDRGLSVPLTKEEAKEVLRQADRAGLMHTTMGGSICNCCSDCCYLFRTQERMKSYGSWPMTDWIIDLDESRCIGCGRCQKRCHLKVFTLTEEIQSPEGGQEVRKQTLSEQKLRRRRVSADTARCAGCGICVSTCPKEALHLKKRQA